jgi:hypothetical protein
MAKMILRPSSMPPPENLPRSHWALLRAHGPGCCCGAQRPAPVPSSPRGGATYLRVSSTAA